VQQRRYADLFGRTGPGHCLPDFSVKQSLAEQRLQQLLGAHCRHTGSFKILWPSSKHLTPRLRVFIDLLSEQLFPL